MLFTSIEENRVLCHIFEISCGAPSHTGPWALRRAGKFPLPGLPVGVGGVGCSSTPGRPSTIQNDCTAACAQYLSSLRKRKRAWCPRHATRRQPAPSRTCGPGSTRHRENSIRKQHASDATTIPRGSGAGAVMRPSPRLSMRVGPCGPGVRVLGEPSLPHAQFTMPCEPTHGNRVLSRARTPSGPQALWGCF